MSWRGLSCLAMAVSVLSAACYSARTDWSLTVANESNQAIFVRLAADGTTKGYRVGPNSALLIGAVDHPVIGTVTILDPGMCRILAPAQSVPSVGDGWVMVDADFHVDVLRHDPDRGFPNAEANDRCPPPPSGWISAPACACNATNAGQTLELAPRLAADESSARPTLSVVHQAGTEARCGGLETAGLVRLEAMS